MNIAIIGGGIGGLAVAYNLAKNWPAAKGAPPTITVYEATGRFGGNGDTVTFDLSIYPTIPNPTLYTRWADLGVNGFQQDRLCQYRRGDERDWLYRLRSSRGLDKLLYA
jgi:protoporphyrinogen oxidase